MLHYNKAGNGQPVVLIHGFCEDNTCFNEQVLLLKEHCTVITPNLPGIGFSELPAENTMQTMADAVYELLQHLNITNCVMIGHSMGGYVTLAYAKKYQHTLKSFGLLHSTALPDDEARKLKRNQAKALIEQKGAAFYAKNFIPPLFHPNTNPSLITPCLQAANNFTAQALSAALMAMKNRNDSIDVIQQTTLPVFFGIGKHDELIPQQTMFNQALLCKQSYIAYLKNSAHMGHLEETNLLAQHILTFIKQ